MSEQDTSGVAQTFLVVGCGSSKADSRVPARDLYTSTYFKKKREYAETLGDQWMILSAEHGLVGPNERLCPYDTTIHDLADDELDELAHAVGMTLIDWVAWEQSEGRGPDRVVVLAGDSYISPLRKREAFATADVTVSFPFQVHDFGGIGEQMAWLSERVKAATQRQADLADFGGGARV